MFDDPGDIDRNGIPDSIQRDPVVAPPEPAEFGAAPDPGLPGIDAPIAPTSDATPTLPEQPVMPPAPGPDAGPADFARYQRWSATPSRCRRSPTSCRRWTRRAGTSSATSAERSRTEEPMAEDLDGNGIPDSIQRDPVVVPEPFDFFGDPPDVGLPGITAPIDVPVEDVPEVPAPAAPGGPDGAGRDPQQGADRQQGGRCSGRLHQGLTRDLDRGSAAGGDRSGDGAARGGGRDRGVDGPRLAAREVLRRYVVAVADRARRDDPVIGVAVDDHEVERVD